MYLITWKVSSFSFNLSSSHIFFGIDRLLLLLISANTQQSTLFRERVSELHKESINQPYYWLHIIVSRRVAQNKFSIFHLTTQMEGYSLSKKSEDMKTLERADTLCLYIVNRNINKNRNQVLHFCMAQETCCILLHWPLLLS